MLLGNIMENCFTSIKSPVYGRRLLCLLLLLLGLGYVSPGLRAQTISGVVYRDFNSDGIRTAPANATGVAAGDVGVPGVVVTAYSSNTGSAPVSVTTTSTGGYTLTTGTGQFRLEFTNLPSGDRSSFRGTGNGTNVQFVTVTAAVTGINFGINYPQNYCSTQDPEVITTCFVSGTPTTATPVSNTALAGGRDVIVGAPYSTTGDARPSHSSIANALAVGSVWGLAYKKTTRQLFSAAFQKRHVGYGPGGPGAIYVTTLGTNLQSGTTAATPFFNFSNVAGAATTVHGPLSVSAGEASYDIQSFSLVGKVGLGDIDISDDEQYLYVVNLFNRRLYQLNIATKDTVSFSIPNNCSTGNSYRPFAVKYHRGKVYVGVVCTREDVVVADANNDGIADTYGPTTGLQGTVYAYQITGTTATTSVALSFPMNYLKAPTNADYSSTTAAQARAEYWRPWTNNFRADRLTGSNPTIASYPQAWLTDIEFDVNDDMILGIRDRYGDQMGYQNYFPISTRTEFVSAISPGEILRAGKCTPADSWTIESNGATCTIPANTTAQTAGQGPGAGKFYWGDRVQQGNNHQLSSLGGLALLGGTGQVIMTAMDPNDIFNTGGVKRLVNATGAKAGESNTTTSPTTGFYLYTDNDITSYGKANGIGDVELLCGPAPVQIGNRVWFDQNQNGIQDPGEQPIAGAVVQLYNSAKTTVLASVTTNAAGEYYFSSASSSTVTSTSAAVTTALTYNTAYAVVISSLGTSTVVTGNLLSLTSVSPRPGESSSINSGTTISNNDAVVEASRPCVRFTTGSEGGAVHNFDFGLTAPCYLSLTVTPGACSSVTNQYTLSGTVNFTNTTAGSVTVSVGTASTVLSVSAATTSLPFTLTGLTSGLGVQTATVLSSASACGTASLTFNAPASCTVPASVTASSATVCAGSPASLTAAGCLGTIQWTGTGITGGATTSVVTVGTSASLTAQTVVSYTATCVLYSSTAVSVGTVTIVPVPSLTITAGPSQTVTQGSVVSLTIAGCSGGTLSGAASTSVASVTASLATNVYSFTCVRAPGCTGTASVTITTRLPASVTASGTTVCAGQPATLTATGCSSGSLAWSGPNISGSTTTSVITVNTSATITTPVTVNYTVTCTTSTSSVATATGSVRVVPVPSLTLTASSLTVVQGSMVTLTTQGCTLGTITGSVSSSSAQVMVTGTTNVYSVTCTNQPNCSGTASVTVTGIPSASLIVSSTTVCAGQPASLMAMGCANGTVTWNGNGVVNFAGNVLNVNTPSGITDTFILSYTATCTDAATAVSAVGNVVVIPIPSLTLTASSLTVVQGSMVTLTTRGCTMGTITGSVSSSSAQVMVTGTTNVYSVTCTNQPNCSGTASVTVTGIPSTSLTVSSATVCAGQTASLTAVGCSNTVSFSNPGTGTVNGNVLTVQTPATTTTLTTLTYVANCTTNVETTTAIGTITIVPVPDVTISAQRSTTTSSVTLSAAGCQNGTLLWSTGEVTPTIVITSGALTLYSVTCTTGPNCQGTDQVRIGQVPPVLDVLVTGGIICSNQSATLTASGCTASLLWNTGQTTATIVVNPAITTVYSVSCSDDLSSVVGSATVIVQGTPAISLSASSPSVTPGQSVTITATGCTSGTLVWSAGPAATGMMSIVDSPTATTTYTATCTTGPQCQSVATVTVTVMPPQTPVLTVTKLVSAARARLGDIISYTIVLANTGTGEATNIQVRDSVSYGLEILTASVMPSVGTYSPGSPVSVWVVPSLPANSTATFTFSASVTAEGVVYNKASVPGSMASACTTIPIRVCQGADYAFQLNAPDGYARYQWFRRATPTSAETVVYDGTLSSFTVTQAGEYRVVVNDVQGQCPDLSCCPFVIEEDSIPQFTVMAQSPTCVNTQPQGNGSLTIIGLGTDPSLFTYQVSAGATFNAGTALPSVAASVPANGVILSNLNTTQTYTVRVYNQQGCYRDVTVTLTVNCACPPQVCVPISIRKTRVTNP